MRSKFSTFGALVMITVLCAFTFAGAMQKHPATNDIGKYGRTTAQAVNTVSPEARYNLPPVGSRGSHSLDDVIISEGFETVPAGQLPAGWIQIDVDQGSTADPSVPGLSIWQVFNNPTGFPPHSGSRFVGNHYNDAALPNDDWLILPQQYLGGPITLSYWAASQDPNYLEDYEVRVSTTGAQPADFTHLIQAFTQISTTWTQHSHDLSAYANAPFYIAFHYNAVDEFVLKIDDVLLEGTQLGAFGTVTGTVTDDNTNNPIQGVNVVLGGGPTTTTDASGIFWFNSVVAGTYTVVFTHLMYESDSLTNVVVTENDTTEVDIELHHLSIEFHDYPSTAPPSPIADLDTAYMNLDVTDDVVINDLDVTINITHTYDSDLTIWLETPWDQRILLAMNVGADGNNFVNTRFDDEATTPIADGAAPFTGSFQPEEILAATDGMPVTGQWTLVVYDGYALDIGTINNFTLHVTSEANGASVPSVDLPSSFAFHGNYPNPFNATTQFHFDMGRTGFASLILYNVVGQEVARLVDGRLEAGAHSVAFDAFGLPSGLYLARFTAPGFAETRKVVLLK